MKKNSNRILLTILMMFSLTGAFSQTPAGGASTQAAVDPTGFYMIAGILISVLLLQSFLILKLVRYITELNYRLTHGKEMPVQETSVSPSLASETKSKPVTKTLWESLTRSVPKGKEKDVMLDHDYDGIRELDNTMPPWLQLIFYSTIIFAILYLLVFHVLNLGRLPQQEYADELKKAAQQKALILKTAAAAVDETNVMQLTDANALGIGKTIFISKCSPCHGMNAEGNVGPNLTDDYWLHGGTVIDIFKTVKYGVPAKGMISWQASLQPAEMQDVVSFVMSLRGSSPANAKAPQGSLMVPGTAGAVADTSSVKIDSITKPEVIKAAL